MTLLVILVLVSMVVSALAEPPATEHLGSGHGELSVGRLHSASLEDPPSPSHYNPSSTFSTRGNERPSRQYGASARENEENLPVNYEFQYDVSDQEAGLKLGHQEQRQGEVARGRYYVLLPDGRTQIVEYIADQDGYRPTINYQGGEGYARGPSKGTAAGYSK